MFFGKLKERNSDMSKTILVTGIGGLTPRSITTIIRENHPDYKIIGCDIDKKAVGFFMTLRDGRKLVDEYYICPRCNEDEYFPWIERLVAEKGIDLKLQASALKLLANQGYDPEMGARPLRRTIQTQVEDYLAEILLRGEVAEGQTLKVGVKSGQLNFTID